MILSAVTLIYQIKRGLITSHRGEENMIHGMIEN